MKCPNCKIDIADSAKKCPFCKEPVGTEASEKFKNFNFKYTITSKEQIKLIRDTVNELSESVAESAAKNPQQPQKTAHRLAFVRKKKVSAVKTADTSHSAAEQKSETESSSAAANKKGKFGFKPLDKAKKLRLGISALTVAAILVVAGIVSLAVGLISTREVSCSAYVYSKDNELYAVTDGKSTKLTSTAVDEDYLTKMSVYADKVSAAEVLSDAKTYKISQNGRYIYYFENYDPDKASGDLYRIDKGNPDSRTKIAASASRSVVLSAKGDKVLFLSGTDENGNMGALYFWEKGLREPFKITTDIDSGTFVFSKDGAEAIFIQNLDREIMQGDLYTKNLKKTKEEKVRLDSGVCRLFGTSRDSKYCVYGKNYDVNDKSFAIFSIGGKNGLLQMSKKTYTDPIICKKSNNIYVIDADGSEGGTLYKAALSTTKREKIADGVNSVQRLSDDEKTLLFDKVYGGKTAECYTYTKGRQPQKAAENILVDFDIVQDTPQLAYTSDLKTFVYIADYSAEKGGTLYRTVSRRGKIAEPLRLAEGVHSCYIGDGGKIVYTKDYSAERGTTDVYSVIGGKTMLLKSGAYPLLFAPAKDCGKIFCVSEYNADAAAGKLEVIDGKANSSAVDTDVFGLDISENGDIFYYKNLKTDNGGSFDLLLLRGGKGDPYTIDKGVQTFAVK